MVAAAERSRPEPANSELIGLMFGMRTQSRSAEHQVARIAARQHGVVTFRQLRGSGLTASAVHRRVAKGLLHRVHRGVYRVGHLAPSTEALYMAAVLACGNGAVLGGAPAAFLYGVIKGQTPSPEIVAPRDLCVSGITTRRVRRLDPRDITVYRRIRITTVPRTVVDLAACLALDDLARTCHEAEVRFGIRAAAVYATLARKPNAPGAWKLHEVFHGQARVTLSVLERRFLDLVGSAALPLPATNRRVDGRYVDCRWPERRLTVELDSYRYHHTRHAWEQDRRRERQARARGDEFRRYTYGDVSEDAELVVRELEPLLA
jgi:hypothetical protein